MSDSVTWLDRKLIKADFLKVKQYCERAPGRSPAFMEFLGSKLSRFRKVVLVGLLQPGSMLTPRATEGRSRSGL